MAKGCDEALPALATLLSAVLLADGRDPGAVALVPLRIAERSRTRQSFLHAIGGFRVARTLPVHDLGHAGAFGPVARCAALGAAVVEAAERSATCRIQVGLGACFDAGQFA